MYLPQFATVVLQVVCAIGFVAGIAVRKRVGPSAILGSLACLAYALSLAPWELSRYIGSSALGFSLWALVELGAPVLQLVCLVLFIVASMSRLTLVGELALVRYAGDGEQPGDDSE
jgi:hypothetical protein